MLRYLPNRSFQTPSYIKPNIGAQYSRYKTLHRKPLLEEGAQVGPDPPPLGVGVWPLKRSFLPLVPMGASSQVGAGHGRYVSGCGGHSFGDQQPPQISMVRLNLGTGVGEAGCLKGHPGKWLPAALQCSSGGFAHLLGGGEGTCKPVGGPAELMPLLRVGLGDVQWAPGSVRGSSAH